MWGEHNSLCVRSVERRVSSIEKIYFQLKVSLIDVVRPPAEFNSDDIWLEAKHQMYTINIFNKSKSTNAVMWYYVDMDVDNPITGEPGIRSGICGTNLGQLESAYFTSENIELYSACEAGIIQANFLLAGVIARLDVEPYKIGGKTVSSYSTPVLWDEASPSANRKIELIKIVFQKEGRIIIDKPSRSSIIDKSKSQFDSSNDYEEHGGPNDGYGGYLSDRFINDALDGEADAYWNLD